MLTEFALGDHVEMRKKHACGGNEWEITRTGADIRIRCVNCGRSVMLDRVAFIRAAKKRLSAAEPVQTAENETEIQNGKTES